MQNNDMSLDEIKEIELNILDTFVKFCKENNLRYYLAYGTLLGAVRHKDFIPWDDDIDVFMPREDFERLAVLWPKYADTDRYSFCRTNKEVNYHHAAASIRDNNTTFIMRHSKDDDINHGLILDIIPLDGW